MYHAPGVALVEPAQSVPDEDAADTARTFGVHPVVPRLWFWQAIAWPAIVGLFASAALAVTGLLPLVPLVVVVSALAAWALARHARAYARRLRLALLTDGLLVERGVWWRTEIFVPRARVQHTDVSQGPVGRRFGVATLKVFTAASHAGVIEIEGLGHGDAVAVRDRLLGREDPDAL
jgi:membrane protein YdbS with pleckstrin-like domain